MHKTYIAADNGTSGSLSIITESDYFFYPTPTFSEQNYTKTKANITRIDTNKLLEILTPYKENSIMVLERPLVNPGRFKATLCAIRALEATLICLEILKIPYRYIDSKEWQKELLPSGCVGDELKSASRDIGKRLFPKYADIFIKRKEADGMLIAEYARRKGF